MSMRASGRALCARHSGRVLMLICQGQARNLVDKAGAWGIVAAACASRRLLPSEPWAAIVLCTCGARGAAVLLSCAIGSGYRRWGSMIRAGCLPLVCLESCCWCPHRNSRANAGFWRTGSKSRCPRMVFDPCFRCACRGSGWRRSVMASRSRGLAVGSCCGSCVQDRHAGSRRWGRADGAGQTGAAQTGARRWGRVRGAGAVRVASAR